MKKIAFIIFLAFLVPSLYLLPNYAMNWDEAVHFYRGESYLHFFITGQKDYKNLPPVPKYYQKDASLLFIPVGRDKDSIARRSMFMNEQINFKWFIPNDSGHPPLSDIFASSFNLILFQKLGLVNDIDSFHVYSIFLAAFIVAVIFLWVSKYYGKLAGLVSAISLATYPIFWAESHFNIKDIPEAVFYALAAITFYEGIVEKKNKLLIISSVLCGFAFATKFNVVFLPFTIIPWLFIYFYPRRKSLSKHLSILPSLIIYPFVPFVIIFACWPFLWQAPVKNFLSIVGYYQSIGNNSGFDQRFITLFGINTYAVQWIIFTTPLIIIFLFIMGIFFAFLKGFREEKKTLFFILLWFIVPVLRVSRPEAGIYGGVRQIMEYVPPMAVLAGLGAFFLRKEIIKRVKFLKRFKYRELILSLFFVLLFVPITIKLISIHPNEDMYFNPLIGGLKGAVSMNLPDWGNSLGNQYRVAIRWINGNADKGSKLTIDVGLGSNIPDNLLREDLRFSVAYRSVVQRKGEYIIGLANAGYEDTYIAKYLNRFLIPIHDETVEGVSVFKIWKNDLEHTKSQYKNAVLLEENPEYYVTGNTLFIDFGKTYSLEEVNIEFNGECTKDIEGSVQISNDGQRWDTLDNSLGNQFFIPFSAYQPGNWYRYYLAADKGRYMEFNFSSDTSCFKSVKNIKIYGFSGL